MMLASVALAVSFVPARRALAVDPIAVSKMSPQWRQLARIRVDASE